MTCPITTSFTPATSSAHGWTPERKVLFLDKLSMNGNARAACRAVGMSAEAAYRLRRRDPLFAQGWAAAVVLGREASVQVLADRAIDGIEEEIYYRGELVGTRRKYDTRLLLAHLARLDALVKDERASKDAGVFDDLLRQIGTGSASDLLMDREEFIDEATFDPKFATDEGIEEPQYDGDKRLPHARRIDRAMDRAARHWDRRARKRHAVVDQLCEAGRMQPAPRPQLDPDLAVVLGSGKRIFQAPECNVRTVSTVSTSALIRGLGMEPNGFTMAERSPFSAPRKMRRAG